MSAAILVPITVFGVLIIATTMLGSMGVGVLEQRRNMQK